MYSKSEQLKKKTRTHRVCMKCDKRRLIKFYGKSTHLICNDCKRKAKIIKKQSSKGYIETKQDATWAKFIKSNAGNRCEYCGKRDNLNAHHIFSRSNKAVRHNLDNGVSLCTSHHVFNSKFSAHLAPTEFIEWIKEYRGLDWYERLRSKARKIK